MLGLRSFHNGLLLVTLVGTSFAQAPTCVCGTDFCLNDVRYPTKLSDKKKEMVKAQFPAELIGLMDLDGACVARIERAPDVFTMKLA